MADGRIVGQHDVEDGDENQEEGEDAQEGRKGQVRDEVPRVVVAELLHDPEYQGGGAESLLRGIDPSHGLLNRLHPYPSRRFVLSYPKLPCPQPPVTRRTPHSSASVVAGVEGVHPLVDDRPLQGQPGQPVLPCPSALRPWARPVPSWACVEGKLVPHLARPDHPVQPGVGHDHDAQPRVGIEAGENPVGAGREDVRHQGRGTGGVRLVMPPKVADGPLATVRGPVGALRGRGAVHPPGPMPLAICARRVRHIPHPRRKAYARKQQLQPIEQKVEGGIELQNVLQYDAHAAVVPRQQQVDEGEGVTGTTVAGENENRIDPRRVRSRRMTLRRRPQSPRIAGPRPAPGRVPTPAVSDSP